MATHYAAYGLHLACSFPLPGTRATESADTELPTLTLDLQDPAELDRGWSGTTDLPAWRGRLGDGLDLTIEHGSAGDLLFAYGHRARFRLHGDMAYLDCAPEHPGLDWQRALISKVIPAVSVMRGYEALHAAAIDSPEGVVAIMAPSGSGKSTLAIELLGRGWPLFADDVLVLEDDAGTISAHPGTPHMNLAEHSPSATDPQSLGDTLGVLAGEHWLAAANTTTHTRPVRMLCLLERGAGLRNETRSLGLSPLPLTPYMLGLQNEAQRQRDRFTLYADLIESTPLVRMTADLKQPPRQLADLLEDALSSHPQLTTSVAH
jgi:hypothetical protein